MTYDSSAISTKESNTRLLYCAWSNENCTTWPFCRLLRTATHGYWAIYKWQQHMAILSAIYWIQQHLQLSYLRHISTLLSTEDSITYSAIYTEDSNTFLCYLVNSVTMVTLPSTEDSSTWQLWRQQQNCFTEAPVCSYTDIEWRQQHMAILYYLLKRVVNGYSAIVLTTTHCYSTIYWGQQHMVCYLLKTATRGYSTIYWGQQHVVNLILTFSSYSF